MGSPFGPITLIANPRAGRGRVAEELPEVERTLLSKGLEYRILEENEPARITALARRTLEEGGRFLVAVGDDLTVLDVVNGMIEDDRPVSPDAVLGVVAAGAECDFLRTFGLPGDATRATGVLGGDRLFPIDVGKVTLIGLEGAPAMRYFPGVAQVGMGASMIARAERLPRALGRGRYFAGFWSTLAAFRPADVRVRVGSKEYSGAARTVVVANCQYHGDGRRISPRSWPSDGLLDVLVMRGPRSDAFTRLPAIYHGEHLPDPNIVEMKGRRIEIAPERPLHVEADGRVLGTTPATFEVLRLALRLKI